MTRAWDAMLKWLLVACAPDERKVQAAWWADDFVARSDAQRPRPASLFERLADHRRAWRATR